MEKKVILLHYATSYDNYLVIWISIDLFDWYRGIFSIVDANKNFSSHFAHCIQWLFGKMSCFLKKLYKH